MGIFFGGLNNGLSMLMTKIESKCFNTDFCYVHILLIKIKESSKYFNLDSDEPSHYYGNQPNTPSTFFSLIIKLNLGFDLVLSYIILQVHRR